MHQENNFIQGKTSFFSRMLAMDKMDISVRNDAIITKRKRKKENLKCIFTYLLKMLRCDTVPLDDEILCWTKRHGEVGNIFLCCKSVGLHQRQQYIRNM